MIHMPLIDESELKLDSGLMQALKENFGFSDGLIIDSSGNSWQLWRCDEIDAWWRLFEEIIDAPMGRKLANAGCDEEEYLLQNGQLDFVGLFSRKKAFKAMKSRWLMHGWGDPDHKSNSFITRSLNPLIAGLMQAQLERINGERYRMRWEQKSYGSCFLSLEKSNNTIPDSKKIGSQYKSDEGLNIEVEYGWKIDGVDYHMLASGIFLRLQNFCGGLTANLSEDDRSCWPDLDDGFISIASASKELFINGEEIFLAADADGWKDSCNSILGSRGLGSPLSVSTIDDKGGVQLIFKDLPTPSIVTGMLAGMWVRCEGRPVKVSLECDDDQTIITLQCKYEIG